jgi:hypothetical protein
VVDVTTFYACLKEEDNGGIPDSSDIGFDSTKCANLVQMEKYATYDKKRITAADYTVSKSMDVASLKVEGKTCETSKNADATSKAFITTKFSAMETVYQIEIFNPSIKGSSSRLEDAVVYVGEKICTKVDSSPPVDQIITLECINVNKAISDGSGESTDSSVLGVEGEFVKIESKYGGDFTACDITIVAKQTDQSKIDALKADYATCKSYQDKCYEKFPDVALYENSENKFNCLQRYGVMPTA